MHKETTEQTALENGQVWNLKPASQGIYIIKGKLTPHRFHIKEVSIPLISEKSIKSLGRWYNECLKDLVEYEKLKCFTIQSLNSIDKTLLLGKLKSWCLQFGLFPHIMLSLTLYEILINQIEKLERTITAYIKKWLDLPCC